MKYLDKNRDIALNEKPLNNFSKMI